MSHRLAIFVNQMETASFDLEGGVYRLGTSPSCDVVVRSDEVAEQAAVVEVRGDAVFLKNQNPYPIYVGDHELRPQEQTEWPLGQAVALTRSVTLSVQNENNADSEEQKAAQRNRKMLQGVLAGVCVLACVLLSNNDSKTSQGGVDPAPTVAFSQLVNEWQAMSNSTDPLTRKNRTVLNYLIDARVADVRWGIVDSKRAVHAYELLLDCPMVRVPTREQETQVKHIREYALARIASLSRVEPMK